MAKSTRKTNYSSKEKPIANASKKRRRQALKVSEELVGREIDGEFSYDVKREEEEEEDLLQPQNKRGRDFKGPFWTTELRRSKRIRVNYEQQTYEGRVHKEEDNEEEDVTPQNPRSRRSVKAEPEPKPELGTNEVKLPNTKDKTAAAAQLQAKKLASYSQYAATHQSPFPNFPRPTPAECIKAHEILSALHGVPSQPQPAESKTPSCGNKPSVLEALIETILSQNTTAKNSTAAKHSLDTIYGRNNWSAVAAGGPAKLEKAIETGGLARIKSAVIHAILTQTYTRHGAYSLEHIRALSDEAAMRELLAFKGVGPKTASCVLLFCLHRPSFAVDTHVFRISGLLGWRPVEASRDETHAHLEARVPDAEKFGLHVLMVRHGRVCDECRAGGKAVGRCELRRTFKGVVGCEMKLDEDV
ncbi:DNA glycosylase [Xylaria nigripes]|nr:DNA glycosylase [Xylaria nigripes]